MTPERDVRAALRGWIAARSGKVRPDELADATQILERRILSSLQVMDLILFLEELSGRPIDVETLRGGAFTSIDAIYDTFFRGVAHVR